MKVILTNDVEGLGEKNEIVDVAAGYARNYLIPRSLAATATKGAVRALDAIRKVDERKEVRHREHAQKEAERIQGAKLTFAMRAGVSGKLYGSVTSADIAAKLHDEMKVDVDRRKVSVPEPIRSIGEHIVPVTIYKGVTINLPIEVVALGELVHEEEETAAAPAPETASRRRYLDETSDLMPSASPERPEAPTESVAADEEE